ncbi:hypothetical protein [Microbacterium gorillae]|uniref:hypothetical protein n=1 Tax=Microbacterium gorillae TaxID=1231063 RepID=UPI003D96B0CA
MSEVPLGAMYSMINIQPEGGSGMPIYPTVGGLIARMDEGDGGVVFTGIDTGKVMVEVLSHKVEPDFDNLEDWEDIAWFDVLCPSGGLYGVGFFGDGHTENFAPGAGRVRVRCSARGRDIDHRGFVQSSQEHYRFDAWLIPDDGSELASGVIKATSKASAYVMDLYT